MFVVMLLVRLRQNAFFLILLPPSPIFWVTISLCYLLLCGFSGFPSLFRGTYPGLHDALVLLQPVAGALFRVTLVDFDL